MKQLKNLGLSALEIRVFKALSKGEAMSVSEIAQKLNNPVSPLYRCLNNLETLGFVVEISGYPSSYQARSLDSALANYLIYQKKLVDSIKAKPAVDNTDSMQVLTGRPEILDTYMTLAASARHSLLTISIGEKMPDELYDLKATLIKKGVKNYLIFQLHNKENDMWLKRWQAIGSEVRLLPGSGYHLNIIDTSYAILSSSNHLNTDKRTAVLIKNPSIVTELRKYFVQQWQQASNLKPLR